MIDRNLLSYLANDHYICLYDEPKQLLGLEVDDSNCYSINQAHTNINQTFLNIILCCNQLPKKIDTISDLLKTDGTLYCLVKKSSILQRICFVINSKLKIRSYNQRGLKTSDLYYVSPNFSDAVHIISSKRFLSQQYFKPYYQWQYTLGQHIHKRILKQVLYTLNAFYITEQHQILEFQK